MCREVRVPTKVCRKYSARCYFWPQCARVRRSEGSIAVDFRGWPKTGQKWLVEISMFRKSPNRRETANPARRATRGPPPWADGGREYIGQLELRVPSGGSTGSLGADRAPGPPLLHLFRSIFCGYFNSSPGESKFGHSRPRTGSYRHAGPTGIQRAGTICAKAVRDSRRNQTKPIISRFSRPWLSPGRPKRASPPA